MQNDNTMAAFCHADAKMTSREIAELVQSRHDDTKRSIERLVERGIIQLPPMAVSEKINGLGKKQPIKEYVFIGEQGKRDSIIVVAQLSPEFTAALVDRWQELEAMQPDPMQPDPMQLLNDPTALRHMLIGYTEKVETLAKERDEAIRTKALIADSRQATVMGRLGQAVKKIDRLETDLGYNRDYKQVKAIPWLKEYFDLTPTAYSQIGKTLTKISNEVGLSMHSIEDARFNKVKAYHADAIDLFRVRLDRDPELLAKYRAEVTA